MRDLRDCIVTLPPIDRSCALTMVSLIKRKAIGAGQRTSLFFGAPGTISTIKRRSPCRSHRKGGHGTSYRHSTTAGSTIPIRRGAGVPGGRGRKIWYEWLTSVVIPTGLDFMYWFIRRRRIAHVAILTCVLAAVVCSVSAQYGVKFLVDALSEGVGGLRNVWIAFLEHVPADLNRRDSQRVRRCANLASLIRPWGPKRCQNHIPMICGNE
jgi:hypothetical protein